VQEKRQRESLESLSEAERSSIAELHAQGLHPTHIGEQLGLERDVADVIQALERRSDTRTQPSRLPARDLSTVGRRHLQSNAKTAKDIAHRHKKQKHKDSSLRKKEKRTLRR